MLLLTPRTADLLRIAAALACLCASRQQTGNGQDSPKINLNVKVDLNMRF